MAIRFSCACGQTLFAPESFAEQTVRCTACGEAQTVPSADTGAAPAAADDWGDPEEQGRPRGGARSRLGLIAGVLLLAGAAVGLYFLLFRKVDKPSADFDLVPRNAIAFVTLRMPDLLAQETGRKWVEALRQSPEFDLRRAEDELGMTLEQTERVTFVQMDRGQLGWVIIKTKADYNQHRVLDALPQKEHHGQRYFGDGFLGVLPVDGRTLAVGPESGIRRLLEQPRQPRRGPLNDAIRLASRNEHSVVAGINTDTLLAEQRTRLGAAATAVSVATLLDTEVLTATANVTDRVDIELTLEFANADTASRAADEVPKLVSLGKGFLPLLPLQVRPDDVPFDLGELMKQGRQWLDRVEPKQDGRRVKLRLTAKVEDLGRLVK